MYNPTWNGQWRLKLIFPFFFWNWLTKYHVIRKRATEYQSLFFHCPHRVKLHSICYLGLACVFLTTNACTVVKQSRKSYTNLELTKKKKGLSRQSPKHQGHARTSSHNVKIFAHMNQTRSLQSPCRRLCNTLYNHAMQLVILRQTGDMWARLCLLSVWPSCLDCQPSGTE